jgi:hypothetical protein
MKRFLAWFAVSFLPLVVVAAVAKGENLLINGAFNTEQTDLPVFWNASSAQQVSCRRGGGPKGQKAAIVLHADGKVPGVVSMRQQGLVLVAGETYKLSAWVKTKGFKSRHAGLVIHNNGWTSATGFTELPVDSDWTLMEKTFKLFPSKGKEYGVAMYAAALTGEMHFADLKLEAISEAALKGSSSQASLVAAPRLVPLRPLLSRIPRANPKLTLRVYGSLGEKLEAYECVVTVGGNRIPQQTLAVKDGKVVASLAGLPVGAYSLEAVLRQRVTQKAIVEVSYPVRIVDLPAIDRSNVRPLNNLVATVLDQPLAKAPAPLTFSFVNPRDGWVFVALQTTAPGADLTVTIDGGDPVITAATARLEAFRELPAGAHHIAVANGPAAGRLVVRSIPEIFNYPPCRNSYVRENGKYDWAFMKKHILPAVTTLNGGRLPGPALPEAKAMGLKWLANFNVAPVNDPVDVRERMMKHPGFTQPQYDGFTSDELFFGRTTIDNYTKALWGLPNPENRRIYTWIVGKPAIPSLHTDFMSACLNASGGRGRLLYEAYCHPQPDERAAAAYLDGKLTETMRRFNYFFPNATAGTGIIFGNFNQMPIISLEHNPAVDFKYFLDMQVNRVANDPAFADLAATGYWGTYYGDEELVRWSFLLMRHYAVEGRKEMLSKRYGFTYNPGFVANPDFATDLKGWDTAPATEGSIQTTTIAGYAKKVQGRWGGHKAGDTVCVMTRATDKPNRISQTMQGLVVGKAYSLQFVTADRKDLADKKYNPRKYGIAAELPGVEILPERCFVHIDRRKNHRRHAPEHLGKINLHRIVFRATTATQKLTFTDAAATPGEELVLNFVQLKPYLE